MNKKVLITGGSGLIGSRLTTLLQQRGYQVALLSRNPEEKDKAVKIYKWDLSNNYIDPEALSGTKYIVHLAGAGVADEAWTGERKNTILKSRTETVDLLYEALTKTGEKPDAFISASGIGIYGAYAGSTLKTEESTHGTDFLAEVSKAWESAADKVKTLGIREVKLRIGIVLSTDGGALKELIKPIKLGAGAPLGSGEQMMSWIHIDDLCRMIIFCMENKLEGPFNAVAPQPVSNKEFTQTAAKAVGMPLILPKVPAFAMKLLLGERASMVLGGANVSAQKIVKEGFSFSYPDLDTALNSLLK